MESGQEIEKQNREELAVVKVRKKGSRELHCLACSRNNDRSKTSHLEGQSSSRDGRKNQGSPVTLNEDLILECSRPWGFREGVGC